MGKKTRREPVVEKNFAYLLHPTLHSRPIHVSQCEMQHT